MKVALLQMDIALGDPAANREKAAGMMAEGLAAGAGLFVLPELWTTGYKLDEISRLAEAEDGPTLTLLRGLAAENRVEIMAGSIAEAAGGKVYNTAYAIAADGSIMAKYRKIHLIGLMGEDKYISPGGGRSLFAASFGQAGMIICYDLRFTELPRAMALEGCRALFVPAQWPAVRGRHWVTLNTARAVENQLFVFAVNRVGRDANNTFFGHSLAVDPWGEVLAEGSADREEVIIAEVDFGAVDEIRKRLPVFADRRPECY